MRRSLGIWCQNQILVQTNSWAQSLVSMSCAWSQNISRWQAIQAFWYISCSQLWCPLPIMPGCWYPCSWVLVVVFLLLCLFLWFCGTQIWNTRWTPFMERGNVNLCTDVDTCWKIENCTSRWWFGLLLGLYMKMFLLLNQNSSPMFKSGVLLTP